MPETGQRWRHYMSTDIEVELGPRWESALNDEDYFLARVFRTGHPFPICIEVYAEQDLLRAHQRIS
jgi:hypothetical protein